MMDDGERRYGRYRMTSYALAFLAICLLVTVSWSGYHALRSVSAVPEEDGQTDISLHPLTPFLSDLALTAVAFALLMLMREVRRQRREAELQHQEIQESNRQLARQTERMRLALFGSAPPFPTVHRGWLCVEAPEEGRIVSGCAQFRTNIHVYLDMGSETEGSASRSLVFMAWDRLATPIHFQQAATNKDWDETTPCHRRLVRWLGKSDFGRLLSAPEEQGEHLILDILARNARGACVHVHTKCWATRLPDCNSVAQSWDEANRLMSDIEEAAEEERPQALEAATKHFRRMADEHRGPVHQESGNGEPRGIIRFSVVPDEDACRLTVRPFEDYDELVEMLKKGDSLDA